MQKSIREIVHDYPTKHKKGFLKLEMLHLLNQFPNINLLRFNDALDHITIMYIDNEMIIPPPQKKIKKHFAKCKRLHSFGVLNHIHHKDYQLLNLKKISYERNIT